MARKLNNMIRKAITYIVLITGMVSCIHNDLPYPKIQQNITALSANGESRAALIDSTNLMATVYLEETVDIEKVSFNEFSITPGGEAEPNLSQGTYDLSSAIVVSISRYQTYQWLIKAEQNIDRYFTIEGEIGETVIDAVGRRIIVTVPATSDLAKLKITSIKLGPTGITTMTPDLMVGEYDFTRPVVVEVEAFGRSEEWSIYVEKAEVLVSTDRADAWSQVVWVYGSCPSDMKGSFQYRKSSSDSWIDVDQNLITQTEGAFSCYIPHLDPMTNYVVRAISGEELGNEIEVTT